MTAEDVAFYAMLAHGADGILAAAPARPDLFVDVHARMRANDHRGPRVVWACLEEAVPECGLPLTRVWPELAAALDRALAALRG